MAQFEWYFMFMLCVVITLAVFVMAFGIFHLIYMAIRDEINNRKNEAELRKKGFLP